MALIVSAADPDAPWQTVTLQPTQLPDGSGFDPASGTLAWTPSAAQGPGDFTVQFVATDTAACGPNQTLLQFVIHVTDPLVLTAQYLTGTLQLGFPALSGETYRVEYCEDLALGDWVLLQEIMVTQPGGATVFDPGPPASVARFYRVVWMR